MSIETRPVPGLFGGLSQKIPAMRDPTQCSAQDNFLASTEVGLFTRPGFRTIRALETSYPGPASGAVAFFATGPDNQRVVVLIWEDGIEVYDRDTGARRVTTGGGSGYLSTGGVPAEEAFSVLQLGDFILVVNKTVTCDTTPSRSPANPSQVAYIEVVNAVAEVSYSITVDGTTVSYATGTSARHANIVANLVSDLTAALGGSYTVTVLPGTNVIKVTNSFATPPLAVSVADSWDMKTMRLVHKGVPLFSDLPARFETGFVVPIRGTAEDAAEDVYYVRWDGDRWVETLKPDSVDQSLDAATMPHLLEPLPGGSWTLRPINWGQRLVGDEDTSPDPSFVGRSISDAFFLRNRLGFLAGDSAILSRAGEYFDFFPRTATQVLDTDPIDVANPESSVRRFDTALVFNQSLLIWTDGEVQMALVGGDILTPSTARLVPVSTFEADTLCRPAPYGNRALFVHSGPEWARLQGYKVSSDSLTNVAEDLSEHTPRLVERSPAQLVPSRAGGMVLVSPRGPLGHLSVLQLEEDRDGERFVQRSWSRILFGTSEEATVLGLGWDRQVLYAAVAWQSAAGGRTLTLERLDPRPDSVDAELGYRLCLDRKVRLTGGTHDPVSNTTAYALPYYEGNLEVVQAEPGKEPAPVAGWTLTRSGLTNTLRVPGNPSGLWAGVRIRQAYEFTEAILRDSQGAPMMSAGLKLLRYLVRFENSGRAKLVVRVDRDGQQWETTFGGGLLGLMAPGDGPQVSSGECVAAVQAQASQVRVSIETDGLLPITVPYAEWVAAVSPRARR